MRITGNQHFTASELAAAMTTTTRPFYALWEKRPQFDPESFTGDLNQLRLFYQSHGYYDAHITYELELHADLVTPHIVIAEGRPVKVDKVSVELTEPGPQPQTLESGFALPLQAGQIFTQSAYQASEQRLLSVNQNNGYSRPEVRRRAVVRR
jgi:outer membrane protein assembly factor BamA